MYFSDLKEDYEKWEKEKGWKKNGISDYIENKQNINLSDHAYLTLQNDMAVFLLQKEQTGSGAIPSDFINQVFCKFRQSANASIACRLQKKELALRSLLQKVKSKEKKDIIKILLEDYKDKLEKKKESYLKQKGNRFYIRINKDNLEYLATEGQNEEGYYNNRISLYIKAVLEEYAEKPYIERERIYYRELIDEIESARANGKILKILLKSERSGGQKNIIKYMKVFKIASDNEHLYNYVVGLISDSEKALSSSKDPWIPGALRLTSIHDCKTLNKPASISKTRREKIEQIIKKRGIQYLPEGDSDYTVMVKFTPRGEKMYQKILHLRPLYTRKSDDRVYEFNCSKLQAKSYFFKFGRDVKILEPSDLAKEFLKQYRAAANRYRQL